MLVNADFKSESPGHDPAELAQVRKTRDLEPTPAGSRRNYSWVRQVLKRAEQTVFAKVIAIKISAELSSGERLPHVITPGAALHIAAIIHAVIHLQTPDQSECRDQLWAQKGRAPAD